MCVRYLNGGGNGGDSCWTGPPGCMATDRTGAALSCTGCVGRAHVIVRCHHHCRALQQLPMHQRWQQQQQQQQLPRHQRRQQAGGAACRGAVLGGPLPPAARCADLRVRVGLGAHGHAARHVAAHKGAQLQPRILRACMRRPRGACTCTRGEAARGSVTPCVLALQAATLPHPPGSTTTQALRVYMQRLVAVEHAHAHARTHRALHYI